MSPWFATVHLRLLLYHTHDAHDILTLLRDILLGHHVTLSRISVFHPDLSTIQRSLDLHNGLSLIQCRRLLLHDITTGACADHVMDASLSPRPDRPACRALCEEFESGADMPTAVLSIILGRP